MGLGYFIVGMIVAYLFYRCECRHQKAKSQIKKLAQEVSAYWCLEKLYSEELAKRDNKTGKVIYVTKGFKEEDFAELMKKIEEALK